MRKTTTITCRHGKAMKKYLKRSGKISGKCAGKKKGKISTCAGEKV
jgi:hypothetical protein